VVRSSESVAKGPIGSSSNERQTTNHGQRTHEPSVSSTRIDVYHAVSWLILRSGLTQLAIALMLGLPGAWGVGQALASVVAQIPPTDPVTFVGIIALLTTVTIAACLIPSWRATRLDPLTALRVE
jgi:hypothetical protein